ncbi:MAG TPA: thioredoxin domain-containing protein [Gemmatimonadales bacterium]
MAKSKQPKVTPKNGGFGKFYLVLGGIAVLALAAIYMNRGAPKADTFVVDPTLPAPQVEGFLMGSPDAPVRIREWADFECPACMQFATVTEPDVRRRLVETGQVQLEYFFFPLEMHRSAASAAYAAACAADQEKFWEMHDAIYQGFSDWAAGRARDPKGVFQKYAERIGLDVSEWSACYDSDRHRELITAHKAAGMARGVNSTPTFFVGDVMVPGAIGFDQLRALVDSVAAASPRAPMVPQGDTGATVSVPATPADSR